MSNEVDTFGNVDKHDALVERVKELECLYDLSALANLYKGDFKGFIEAASKRIAQAWLYSKDAMAEVVVEGARYSYFNIKGETVKIKEALVVDDEIVGMLYVHYPMPKYTESDFLPEEHKLLKKLAQEVSSFIERKKRLENEEALKRIVERQDRLSILGEITAGIAHELNTPLGNILGFSEFIQESVKEPNVYNDAKKIKQSALHAREVVKKLMFFSCEMPQQMKSVAINPLVEDALDLLKPLLQNARVSIKFTTDKKNPFGRLDPVQFTQVVFNLVVNAIHASPEGSIIEVSLQTDSKYVRLTVMDKGVGIADEDKAKIFDPFFTTKSLGKGSGLGLSMVHGIVKSHKGHIQFSSQEGQGTTFVVSIPLYL